MVTYLLLFSADQMRYLEHDANDWVSI